MEEIEKAYPLKSRFLIPALNLALTSRIELSGQRNTKMPQERFMIPFFEKHTNAPHAGQWPS